MPSINSKAISYVEYDELTRELSVTFTKGHTYVYYNVPPSIYVGLLSAGSAGTYFNARIKDAYSIR